MVSNSVLVITGGTGTFGNAVLRRFRHSDLKEIRIFSRDEKKQDDMRRQYADPRLKFYIGDVRDPGSLSSVMRGADFVFHAAALKQVPSCEFYPIEAIRTNTLGTDNVLRAAEANGVHRVIVLSTDKAAYPVNAMGMSKALAEKVMIARSRSEERGHTVACATRYGNVMASRGSVIPLFLEQIAQDQPLTVTDLRMTRFMMSIDEAVDLVDYAFQHGRPGDLFVRKAPAATLQVLVDALSKLFERELPCRVIGTRHGEKLFETLLTREEMAHAEDLGEYYRTGADVRGLNYAAFFTEGEETVSNEADYTSHNTAQLSADSLAARLETLPEVRAALTARRR